MDLALLEKLRERVLILPSYKKPESTIYYSIWDTASHYHKWRKQQNYNPFMTGIEFYITLASQKDHRLSSMLKFFDLKNPRRARKIFRKDYKVPFEGMNSWKQAAEIFEELLASKIFNASECRLVYGPRSHPVPLVTACARLDNNNNNNNNNNKYVPQFRSFDTFGQTFIDSLVDEFSIAHEEIVPSPKPLNSRGHISLVYSKQ